jgi:hypothetical protein
MGADVGLTTHRSMVVSTQSTALASAWVPLRLQTVGLNTKQLNPHCSGQWNCRDSCPPIPPT